MSDFPIAPLEQQARRARRVDSVWYSQDESGREGQDINMFNKDMTGVTATSAADVTADLNGVLNQIRNGMIHGEHVESPGTLTPRKW